MKALSLLVLLPLLLACTPQSEQARENQVPQASAPGSHATEASARDVHAVADSAVAAKPVPANGWSTDAPLRQGMGRIRLSVDALGHYQLGHMGAEQAVEMAANVEQDVNFLIANCKLDPDADAALHGIIAKLLKGAQALKANPADLAAIAPMRDAMAEYARDFDDPDFRTQPVKP